MKAGFTTLLWLCAIGLAYWLYTSVNDPVQFNAAEEMRSRATKDRLLDIKVAQDYYYEIHNTFADDLDDLVSSIKNEKLTIIKTIGNEDDTTVNTTYDTILVPIWDEIVKNDEFRGTKKVEDLKYVPFTKTPFDIAIDTIKQQRVELIVFEAKTTKQVYLEGLKEKYIKNPGILDLSIGSLTSASGKGSWE